MTSYSHRRDGERVSMGSADHNTHAHLRRSSQSNPSRQTSSHGRVTSSTPHQIRLSRSHHETHVQQVSSQASSRTGRTVRSHTTATHTTATHTAARTVRSERRTQVTKSQRRKRSSPSVASSRKQRRRRSRTLKNTRTVTQSQPTREHILRGFGDARKLIAPKPVMSQLEESAQKHQGFFAPSRRTDGDGVAVDESKRNGSPHLKRWIISFVVIFVVACVAVLCAWVLFFSPLFAIHASDVQIHGDSQWINHDQVWSIVAEHTGLPEESLRNTYTQSAPSDTQSAAQPSTPHHSAASSTGSPSITTGRSEFAFSSDGMERELSDLPAIASVKVEKKLPHEVLITITPRVAQAQLVDQSGAKSVVDSHGVVLSSMPQRLTSVPLIHVSSVTQSLKNRAVQQVLQVLSHIPPSLRGTLSSVTAMTQDSVTTVTGSGISIMWGDASQMKLKGEIVQHILVDHGLMNGKKTIDVSAPLRPIVR
jgi:cell division protein FtsQ